MAFRKQVTKRVFVDESIPSFLTEPKPAADRTDRRIESTLPPPPGVNDTSANTAYTQSKQSKPLGINHFQEERRNRPLILSAPILVRMVMLAILLNSSLYWLFRMSESKPDILMRVNKPDIDALQGFQPPLEERIITYSYTPPKTP